MIDESNWVLVKTKDIQTLKKWFETFQNIEFDRQKIRENFLARLK
jgi:hypothetical protein